MTLAVISGGGAFMQAKGTGRGADIPIWLGVPMVIVLAGVFIFCIWMLIDLYKESKEFKEQK